ncbi:hypothetical protein QBC38DRAFT_384886 [Podospora fimiseda]|uniref:Uncharacterized protein n=1 Tax=Podospora fimiseda TaxID=252190 RepID=A0AAN7BUY5_9PEZI|nr:hypothetical protein QBC38DRAFT_384886 [Podospora fimiseda]
MAHQERDTVLLSKNLQTFGQIVEVEERHGDTGRALVHYAKRQRNEDADLIQWKRWWASTMIENGGFEINEDLELLRQCRELTLVWKDFRKSSVFKKIRGPIDDDTVLESGPPSLNTLITTCCANHRTVAEGFTRAIQEIGAYFSFIQKTGKVMSMFEQRTQTPLDTREVRLAISRAYIPVFKFLCYAMEWHSSSFSRFKTTFNVKFYGEKVKEFVEEVKRLAEHLDRVVTQAIAEDTNKKVYEIADQTMYMSRDVQMGGADQNRRLAAADRSRDFSISASLLSSQLGLDAARTLISSEEADVFIVTQIRREGLSEQPPQGRKTLAIEEPKVLDSESESSLSEEITPSRHYSRAEITQYTQSLVSIAEDDRANVIRALNTNAGASIAQVLPSALQQWLRLDKSAILWVEGAVFPADLSPTALRVSIVTTEAGIPCISFFDKPRYSFPPFSKPLSQKQAGLIALLCSFICQLVNVLPPVFESRLDFNRERFAKVDGSSDSLRPSLDIIKDFLSYVPPSLVCVVDGLQAIEDRETVPYLERFVSILREQGQKTVVKVLFTTDGMSLTLAKKTKGQERFNVA